MLLTHKRGGSYDIFWAVSPECQKRCPGHSGKSRDTFWTLWSPGPEGPRRHPVRHSLGHPPFSGTGHSRGHSGNRSGLRDSCSRPGGFATLVVLSCATGSATIGSIGSTPFNRKICAHIPEILDVTPQNEVGCFLMVTLCGFLFLRFVPCFGDFHPGGPETRKP